MAGSTTPNLSYRKIIAALRESEERYRTLVEGVRRYAIFMLDTKGIILTWNRGIYELFGYDREDIVGKPGAMMLTPKERAKGAFAKEMAEAAKRGEAIRDRTGLRKDGTEMRIKDVMTALHDPKGALLGFAKVAHELDHAPALSTGTEAATELAKALATIQIEVEHRRRLEAALLTAVEEERERLGRDLHDDLSQRLAAIGLMAASLAKKIRPDNPTASKRVEKLSQLISKTGSVGRDPSRRLHPVTLRAQGLPAALEELAERVPAKVEFTWPNTKRLALDPAVALHAYRIAEEAVGNAIKHSGADTITIDLETVSSRNAVLSIRDNGKGFGPRGHQGMGLQNMKYRANVLKGQLTIESSLNQGTRIMCTIPMGPMTLL